MEVPLGYALNFLAELLRSLENGSALGVRPKFSC